MNDENAPRDETDVNVALVTGANKGIGYAVAAELGRLGFAVGVGARDEQRRRAAVTGLTSAGVRDVFEVPLDVTDEASVVHAVDLLRERFGRLDVLVNNAGTTGGAGQDPLTLDLDVVRAAFETNVVGVVRVTNAFLPLLQQAATARVVNVSSHLSSLAMQTSSASDFWPVAAAYAPSKTYLNALGVQYAKALAGSGIVVTSVCPGYVRTDINQGTGDISAEEAAHVVVQAATAPEGTPGGRLIDANGAVSW